MAGMMRVEMGFVTFWHLVILCVFWVRASNARDTLVAGQAMQYWDYLESSSKEFRLLFVSLGITDYDYLGIQFMNYSLQEAHGEVEKMVWLANGGSPFWHGSLNVTRDGNLVLTGQNGNSITLNDQQPALSSSNASVTLLDTGNLVLRAGDQILWQSFDHPSDTWLPGMKLGLFNLNTGQPESRVLTSFLSSQAPAKGHFTFGVDPNNTKQLVIWRKGVVYWRSGIWNGRNFSYFPNDYYRELSFTYFSDESQNYFTFTGADKNLYSWIEMGSTGTLDIFGWARDELSPSLVQSLQCDAYLPKGCALPEPSKCKGGDVFGLAVGTMDSWDFFYNSSLGIDDCREICTRNCSCHAYASLNSDGTGCKFSRGQKSVDMGELFYNLGRLAAEESQDPAAMNYRKRQPWFIIGVPVFCATIIASRFLLLCYLRRRNRQVKENNRRSKHGFGRGKEPSIHELQAGRTAIKEFSSAQMLKLGEKKDQELPFLSFSSIEIATNCFSAANKIGQGGFGPVYKGKLVNGQEIAVKRLSRSSRQGREEFKNEVMLISKLQHRNLVRLMGCCIQGEERILIYEYLPNKSLDYFLFDTTKRALLDWKLRFCIIEGIAQGLLYLHKYSRLRIIHRDLKVSNILLDNEMNPKISDFGTARIFGENESQANTSRIIGTYGYMSPEYAMDGLFSVKSDVFSFGVMMLEILVGKRNTIDFYHSNRSLNLLGYAWELWKEGRAFELMDPLIAETCSTSDMVQCVQVALLCVQESAADRLTMSEVLSMLSNGMLVVPTPKQPAFSTNVSSNEAVAPQISVPCSVNNVTISEVEGR